MIKAYFNYPNSRMRMHADPNCSDIEKSGKSAQRKINMNRESLHEKLVEIGKLSFTSTKAQNDLWLTIDFGNLVEEEAEAKRILKRLGERYKRFRAIDPISHC
jgi:hypothetical protein